jgi:ABC-2 type transport system permease protein
MNGFRAVCKRELKGYFATPVAYVFLVIFLFFAGYLPFERGKLFINRQADLRVFFDYIPLLFVFMVPATAMRLWAEERKSGSIELLLTLPITVRQAVLGKFVAAWLFLGIALALTFPMPLTVAYLGRPDWGAIAMGYLGSFLMAGAYLAVGCFFSALSKNQVISFILAVVACAILMYVGLPSTLNYLAGFLPMGLVHAAETASFQTHFESMQRGVLELRDLAYFVLMIAGWVVGCMMLLEERKAA